MLQRMAYAMSVTLIYCIALIKALERPHDDDEGMDMSMFRDALCLDILWTSWMLLLQ